MVVFFGSKDAQAQRDEGALTVGQLIAQLRATVDNDPKMNDALVALEGCDCFGVLGDVKVRSSGFTSKEAFISLERTESSMGGL